MPVDEITSALLEQIKDIDERDEKQVLAELAGETVRDYIYETEVWDEKLRQKVRKVKLSWIGTREAARNRGNIVPTGQPQVTDLDDGIRIVVQFTDLKRNFSVFGGCHQPRKMKVKDFDEVSGEFKGFHLEDDPFVFQKGLSKAQRNALNSCIPADFLAKQVDYFLKATGKPALQAPTGGQKKQKTAPTKADIKPQGEWEAITPEQVKDLAKIFQVMWNLSKMNPDDVWLEIKNKFGYESKTDMTKPEHMNDAWFFLKQKYCPNK